MAAGFRRRKKTNMAAAASSAAFAAGLAALPGAAAADGFKPYREPSFNLYGVTGLIDMPSAEVQPDAQFSFTSGYFDGFLRNTLTFQALPRFETTFRYSILDGFFDDGTALYDRSFDIKFKFMDEGVYRPAMAIGLQDFLGTGIYSGEYIVATKHVTPDITVTGGMGWGRFAGHNTMTNPLTYISPKFETRTSTGDTGNVQFGQFFRGQDVGFFGGVSWDTPVDGLRVKAEISSDAYTRELANRSDTSYPSQLNLGVEYRPYDGIELGAYYMYGKTFGLRASFSGNPNQPLLPQDIDDAPPPIKARKRDPDRLKTEFGEIVDMTDAGEARTELDPAMKVELDRLTDGPRWATARSGSCDRDAALAIDAAFGVVDGVTFVDGRGNPVCTVILRQAGRDRIVRESRPGPGYSQDWAASQETRDQIVEGLRKALGEEGISVEGIRLDPDRVAIDIGNTRYHAAPQAIGRTARVLTRSLPPSVEYFEITPVESGLPTTTITLRRALLEEQSDQPDATQRSWLSAGLTDAPPRGADGPQPPPDLFPRYTWGLTPALRTSLFDPDAPLRYDLGVRAFGTAEVMPGLSFTGSVTKSIVGNLDDITRESNSVLPHVRSDIALYEKYGDPTIDRLTTDYLFKLDDDLFGRASLGYLERMYAGASAELLWKPAEQSWGLGAELNYVVQRDYDQLFGFRDYDVVTGHASVYWDTGYYGLEAQVDAGRYLAGDYGATFSLSRRFANGWEVGGFFTLTDVPFSEYGEGSFDKGIRLTIPLNWSLPYESRTDFSTTIRPLTRDGGARLDIANRLYPIVRDMDAGGLHEDWGTFWR